MTSPSEFYRQNIEALQQQLSFLQRRINAVSGARFAAIVVAIVMGYFSLYGGFGVPFTAWILLLGSSLLMFAVLVTYHARLYKEREESTALLEVNTDEHKALSGDFEHIPNGSEFLVHPNLPQTADFALDLDIFGKSSLYQRINRTVTPQGTKRLAECLVTPLPSKAIITERHSEINELVQRTDFRQRWQASRGKRTLSEDDTTAIQTWLQEEGYLQQRGWVRIAMVFLPTVFLCGVGMIFTGSMPEIAQKLMWTGYAGNLLFSAMLLQRITREASLVKRFAPLLSVYVRLLNVVIKAQSEQSFATNTPRSMNACAEEALEAIQSLAKLTRRFEEGKSLAGALFLNGTVLWNLYCARQMERWRIRFADKFGVWMNTIAETDALVSLAGFAYNHPNFTTPTIIEEHQPSLSFGSTVFHASGLGHPFIADGTCVRSDVRLDETSGLVCIITGANMAGKSTFLRALGLNTVLAMIGIPVNAVSFECSVMKVLTSMRATDSLERHESYFFAELQRLRQITEYLQGAPPRPALVLLDEILRGTNSTDKQSGTIGLLHKFIAAETPTLIATHDTDVGVIVEREYPQRVRNYCFEGRIEQGELVFDYMLRHGIAANKNATFLMQKMGII